MAKQQAQPISAILVGAKEFSMQRHIHIHKKLQRAMLMTWRKMNPAHANRLKITTQP